jgi:hypothetical protein
VGRLEDVGPPVEMDGGSTTELEGDHMAGLKEEYRPGGTWAERSQKAQTKASSSSPPQYEHGKHPIAQWRRSQAHSVCSPETTLGAPEAQG